MFEMVFCGLSSLVLPNQAPVLQQELDHKHRKGLGVIKSKVIKLGQ